MLCSIETKLPLLPTFPSQRPGFLLAKSVKSLQLSQKTMHFSSFFYPQSQVRRSLRRAETNSEPGIILSVLHQQTLNSPANSMPEGLHGECSEEGQGS